MSSSGKSINCKLWEDCLNYISMRAKKSSFQTWFKPTRGELNGDGELKIFVPNQFIADWLMDRYHDLISDAIKEVHGSPLLFQLLVMDSQEAKAQTEIEFHRRPLTLVKPSGNGYGLNERYRFESLVVGNFNQFAHAAAVAVAEAPGKTKYNPLFIYGRTGLGKTHLIQAIGNYIYENSPNKRVIYATSERFTSDFISALSNGTLTGFTTQYRSADVLLVDDIQFFSGKESTQEQFFHTFNDLDQLGKQIVLTSDRHPKDTKGLEERLLSRFSSGLVADLQPPDLETRMAILRRRTEQEGIKLPEDVLFFIADNVTSNIRELEGCLTRLSAYSSLEKTAIDLDFAVRILGKEIIRPKRELTISEIKKRTSEFFHIDPAMMTAKKKTADVALARQVAMYLSRKHTASSLKGIGESFGGRDHSTVIHACTLIEKRVALESEFREKIRHLTSLLLD